jgi:Type II CAAX prenyl endopeptidase Rce1-like
MYRSRLLTSHGSFTMLGYAIACVVAVAIWLLIYRLPFGDPSRRRRIALWLADRSGLHPDMAYAIFGTVLYLVLGLFILFVLMTFAHLSVSALVVAPSLAAFPAVLLAAGGTSSLNILAISFLYRARPKTNIPEEISQIQWISSILALPPHFRWIIPAAAALVEELVFRGAVFMGLGALGSGFWLAWLVSTLLFTLGQIVLVSTPIQGFVMGISSITLGTFGSLLIVVTGSITPAVILHMSFAGFYTNMSSASAAGTPRIPKG